jgi:hypothetical protein
MLALVQRRERRLNRSLKPTSSELVGFRFWELKHPRLGPILPQLGVPVQLFFHYTFCLEVLDSHNSIAILCTTPAANSFKTKPSPKCHLAGHIFD